MIERTSDTGSTEEERLKVLLVDDHSMFREGLAGLLGSPSYADQVEVVGKTYLGQEAVALARKKDPDVVLMQVDRTLEKAKYLLEQVREGTSSPPKVIILTMFEEPHLVRKIMDLGTNAYVHKSVSMEELFAVLRAVVLRTEGAHAVVTMPQRALELSVDGLGKDGAGRVLTRRELELLLQAARGQSNRQISSSLDISEATVKRHLANMYPKMGVSSRGEAVRMALENEWFTIHEIQAAIEADDE